MQAHACNSWRSQFMKSLISIHAKQSFAIHKDLVLDLDIYHFWIHRCDFRCYRQGK